MNFTSEEFARRRAAVASEMAWRNLYGLLMFRQESMYYLTGYEGFGYVFFQCLYIGSDGESLTLLTRIPDALFAKETSNIPDIRPYPDAPGVNPAEQLRAILEERGCRGKRLGVETDAYGLTGYNLDRLRVGLGGLCELVESSDLVTKIRAVKSPAETEYIREAARLADDGFDRALPKIAPGAFEGEILGALQAAIFEGGGDFPGNNQIIGSGRRGLLFRDTSGMRHLDPVDHLSIEWAGTYRRYHSAMMETVFIGKPAKFQQETFPVVQATLEAMAQTLVPGRTIGEVDEVHRRKLDAAGLAAHRLSACGYSLGSTFQPSWMDRPAAHSGNRVMIQSGMVIFLHCLVLNFELGLPVTAGRTYLVTESGNEMLSRRPVAMIVV